MGEQSKKQKNISRILFSFLALCHSRDTINFKNIRLSCLKYMLIFPLAPVFANMQGSLFKGDLRLLGLDPMTLMGSAYCVGAGVLFAFFRVRSMAAVSRLLAVITGAAFASWLLMPESRISLTAAALFTFGLGGCAACVCFAYTFALNNAERFLGAAMISLFFVLMQLNSGLSILTYFSGRIYLVLLVAGTVTCMVLYRKEDFTDVPERTDATLNPALKLMLYFFVAHYFVEIFYTYLPGASTPNAMVSNGLAGILAVCLSAAMQITARRSVWHMCNLFFVAVICTYALYFMPEGSVGRSIARFLHGFEQMGYIASYYLVGCVFKKYGDFRLFKCCLVVILPASMVTYVIPGALTAYAPALLPLAATFAAGVVFMVFVMMSPAYSKHLFSAAWSDDFCRIDMTGKEKAGEQPSNPAPFIEEEDRGMDISAAGEPAGGRGEQVGSASSGDAACRETPYQRVSGANALLTACNLRLPEKKRMTSRELEIAGMLLARFDYKTIAGKLFITENTLKTHIKHIYKKLGVNSKKELNRVVEEMGARPDMLRQKSETA